MMVHFRNSYPSKVWVAIMCYDPVGCRGDGDWATQGWWGIAPGQEVWAFSTGNRYAAFYAEADDGAHWSGPYGPVYVYWEAFNSCVNIGSTAAYETVGMRLIDLGPWAWVPWGVHTANLLP
jgi:hypothetical protein